MKNLFLAFLLFTSNIIFSQTSISIQKNREAAEKEVYQFVSYLNQTYFSYQQEYVNFLGGRNSFIPGNMGAFNIFDDMLTSLRDDISNFSREIHKKYVLDMNDNLVVDSLLDETKTVWVPNFKSMTNVIKALNESKLSSIQKLSADLKDHYLKDSFRNYKKFLKRMKDKWTIQSRKFGRYKMQYNFFSFYLDRTT
jgi:hypothetical protein